MLDATIYGPRASAFHATNILLHVLNVLLVFALFTQATGRLLRSAFVAALFAVHPLHVESVAWIAERKDVLSMFFGLLSLWCYVRSAKRRRPAWLVPSLACFALSLSAKQTFVTLPFLCLLLDFWPLGRLSTAGAGALEVGADSHRVRTIARLLVEKIPFFVISAIFCRVAISAQSFGHSVRTLAEMPLQVRLLNALAAYGRYVDRTILPLRLSLCYPHPGRALTLSQVGAPGPGRDRDYGPGGGQRPAAAVPVRRLVLVSGNARADDRPGAGRPAADGRPLCLFARPRAVSGARVAAADDRGSSLGPPPGVAGAGDGGGCRLCRRRLRRGRLLAGWDHADASRSRQHGRKCVCLRLAGPGPAG